VAHSDLIFWLCHDPHTSPQALSGEVLQTGTGAESPVPACNSDMARFGAAGAESGELAPVPVLCGSTEKGHARRLRRLEGCAYCYRATLLVLAPGGERRNTPARALFERAGVAPDRLALVPTCPREAYLRLAGRVDVLLDPFPYAGMTTTCDFLWMGVPTVTLAGSTALSRAGVTLLRAVGLSKLIAHTTEQYVRTAADLARDLSRLAGLRAGLRARMASSPLRDERGLTARLESAYRAMWRAWCASGEPGATVGDRVAAPDLTSGN
jgi:Glycosyl transferase family 41